MATANRHPQVTIAVTLLWRLLRRDLFDTYRPELHYMRGPGPKCRAKHQNPSQAPDVGSLVGGIIPNSNCHRPSYFPAQN
jgi:hypothetical protein